MKKLLSIIFVAVLGLVLVSNETFAANKEYLYNGVNHQFGEMDARTIFDGVLDTTTAQTFTGEECNN